ncbi:DUF350 domain-containing protein [Blastococcus saxobsidens]|uniref:Uncharacterized membrane protein YjfL (UPF0719 family) n=1 Tax=Blastococcus saxobsidens TaxID=138336 RepID=A0A4Q7Y625_9ACTN|nr:DUF350 domain-containing protein [Blastococcus saxobsidens]RZU31894.1 uncharacterized membrane protein YjfL (UPF0719 family) [Blastococcus saxobsidens]
MSTTWQALEFGTVDGDALGQGVVATLLFFVIGVGVLALGFLALDLLTPGNLRTQVYLDHNPNAAILLGANHLALAIIVVTAIMTSGDSLAQGLVDTAVYGLVGVLLQALALRVLDAAIPADLRALVNEPRMRGSAWAVGISLVAIGAVNAAALS